MLNQHYLEKMFPISSKQNQDKTDRMVNGALSKAVSWLINLRHNDSTENSIPFLDRVVDTDTATVMSRDKNAAKQLTIMRQDSMPLEDSRQFQTPTSSARSTFNNLPFSNLIGSSRTQRASKHLHQLSVRFGDEEILDEKDLAGAEGSRISVAMAARAAAQDAADEASGKKVRELSRLWRYMGGESPED